MLLQLHVAHDVSAERARVMRQRRATEAGMKFFGDGRAAHLGAAFQHQRFESRFGEVEGGDQTVVPAADDDDIARFSHALLHGTSGRLPIFQNFERRQTSRRAHDAAARMRGRSAHVKVLDGRAELCPSGNRAEEK